MTWLVPDSDWNHGPARALCDPRREPCDGIETAAIKANQRRLALVRISQQSSTAVERITIGDKLNIPKVPADEFDRFVDGITHVGIIPEVAVNHLDLQTNGPRQLLHAFFLTPLYETINDID
ncbi:MAG: hypothetical protein WD648_16475 [Planctomycetaceae bacterium]